MSAFGGKNGRGADLSVCPLMTQTGHWVGNDQGHRSLPEGASPRPVSGSSERQPQAFEPITPAYSPADKVRELKGLLAIYLAPGALADWRCGTHEQTHERGLLRRAGLGVNVLQVGPGRGLADPQHLSRFFYAKPWHHGEEHT